MEWVYIIGSVHFIPQAAAIGAHPTSCSMQEGENIIWLIAAE
ncbi:hypothetical protein [Psychromonas ingrahamii]|nr:hypothetical protein [Psychromonas ingrahamii]